MAQRRKFDRLLISLRPHYIEFLGYIDLKRSLVEISDRNPNSVDKSEMEKPLTNALRKAETMMEMIRPFENAFTDHLNFKVESMLAALRLHIAFIHGDSDAFDEETKNSEIFNMEKSEQNLQKVIAYFNAHGVRPLTVLPVVGAMVELARIYEIQEKINDAIDLCIRAEQVCMDFRKTHSIPIGFAARFGINHASEDTPDNMLDTLQMKGVNLAAIICATDFDETTPPELRIKVVEYGISAQQKMFSRLNASLRNFDETIKNMILFAAYFRDQGNFDLAKHQMGAASQIIHLLKVTATKAKRNNDENYYLAFNHWRAEVCFNWAMYALRLMDSSRQRMEKKSKALEKPLDKSAEEAIEKPLDKPAEETIEKPLDKPAEEAIEKPLDKPAEEIVEKPLDKPVEEKIEKQLDEAAEEKIEKQLDEAEEKIEKQLDEAEETVEDEDEESVEEAGTSSTESVTSDIPLEYEMEKITYKKYEDEIEAIVSEIPDQYITDYEEALIMSKLVKDWLDDTMLYNVAVEDLVAQVKVARYISQMYRNVIYYAPDDESKADIHKQRITNLEAVLERLQKLDPASHIVQCRDLWMELADTYIQMRDIKYGKLDEKTMTEKEKNKKNHLSGKAIKYLEMFRESMKKHETELLPLGKNILKVIMNAYVTLFLLYVACSDSNPEYVKKSQEISDYMKNYHAKHLAKEEKEKELDLATRDFEEMLSKLDQVNIE